MFHIFSLKITKRKALAFANFEAIERFSHTKILSKNLALLALRLFSITLIILAVAGINYSYIGKIAEINFILAIDASGSMLATDFIPNRFEAAKNSALEFVNILPFETKVGLVTFSGATFIRIKPTKDEFKVTEAIKNIETELIAGTAIGDAIITSTNILLAEQPPNSLILITDGQNNIGASIQEAVEYSKSHNIIINTIGIGTEEGGTFENYNESIISIVNYKDLEFIASETNGKSFLVSNEQDMKKAYSEIANIKEGSKTIELKNYLLILGMLVLSIEWLLLSSKYRTIP